MKLSRTIRFAVSFHEARGELCPSKSERLGLGLSVCSLGCACVVKQATLLSENRWMEWGSWGVLWECGDILRLEVKTHGCRMLQDLIGGIQPDRFRQKGVV